jgi:hypothetical protein
MSTLPIPVAHADYWRKCSSCKKPIAYSRKYWVCNVSTCNRKRTGLIFCDVSCWDAHVPMMNHRDTWAEERRSPSLTEWQAQLKAESEPKKRPRAPKPEAQAETAAPAPTTPASPPKVLIRRKANE